MPRSTNQNLKLFYLEKIFREETNENNPMNVSRLIQRLESFGIKAERKSIYSDIKLLNDYVFKNSGGEVLSQKGGRSTAYYLSEGYFTKEELGLLADSIACSKFFSKKKSNELIAKLQKMTDMDTAKTISRTVFVANRPKNENESIYLNVSVLQDAIDKKKKVSFKYFVYDTKKKKVYRHEGEPYVISPYLLTWNDENYYVVGYYDGHEDISNFRIDYMDHVEIVDEKVDKPPVGFDKNEYTKQVFGMFSGDKENVTLIVDNNLVRAILDKFGSSVRIIKVDDNRFRITVPVIPSPPFYAWVFQFSGKITIDGPERVKENMISFMKETMSAMENNE